MLKKTISLALFLALLALLIAPPTAVMAQATADSAVVRERVEAYQRTWNTHDPTAVAAFFTEDADFVMGNLPLRRGRREIRDWWRDYFARQEPERGLTLVLNSVRFVAADVAVINVATTTGGRDRLGQELPARRFRGTWVLVRQEDEWFISAMRGMPTEGDRIIRASDQDQLEVNKELVRQLGAINDAADWDRLDTLLSDDFHRHSMATTESPEISSRDEFKQHEQAIRAIWPDRHVTYEMIVAEGDMVAAYATFAGTNKETGKPIELKYLVMMRIKDGKIAEIWVEWDNLAVQRQLGLWPPSATAEMPPETTPEQNKEIVRRVMAEGVNAHNLEVFRAMLALDYARHSQATTETPEIRGVEAMLEFLKANFTAFPDWHEKIELMIAEGDKVAYITTGTGTHTGPMGDIPPTGKKMKITNYTIQRIENGKIAETWIGWDNLAALVQLGLFPPPGAGGE